VHLLQVPLTRNARQHELRLRKDVTGERLIHYLETDYARHVLELCGRVTPCSTRGFFRKHAHYIDM
jgi:hypothetical protein